MSDASPAEVASEVYSAAWRRRTVWDLVTGTAGRVAAKEALVNVDTEGHESRLTYAELVDLSRRLSAGLAAIGVRRGDRLALWMTNVIQWVPTFLAALRIGAVVVPINTWLTADEISYVLSKAGARHLVMMDRFRRIDFRSVLERMAPEWLDSRAGRLYDSNLPELRSIVMLYRHGVGGESRSADYARSFDWKSLLDPSDDQLSTADSMAKGVVPEDLAMIKFTSGSTGFPKGVLLENWGVVTNALLHTERLGVGESDRWFSQNPLFHAGGSIWGLMSMLSRGGTLIFTEANDGQLAARLLEEERCTFLGLSRPMFQDIRRELELRPREYSSIWGCLTTDITLIEPLRTTLNVRKFYVPYGMTELYGPASVGGLNDEDRLREAGWGRPLDGQELRVVDPATGKETSAGEVGEIQMRGLAMRGYHESPDQTAEAIDAAGWVHSQDLGVRDASGYLRFVGRLKAMLKVGGENVAVEEVEDVIARYPQVAEVAVIGVPDSRKGEVPRAYVVPVDGDPSRIDLEGLRTWCAERLARFKVPRDFLPVSELPHTGSNKIDRAALIRRDKEARELEHIQVLR